MAREFININATKKTDLNKSLVDYKREINIWQLSWWIWQRQEGVRGNVVIISEGIQAAYHQSGRHPASSTNIVLPICVRVTSWVMVRYVEWGRIHGSATEQKLRYYGKICFQQYVQSVHPHFRMVESEMRVSCPLFFLLLILLVLRMWELKHVSYCNSTTVININSHSVDRRWARAIQSDRWPL